jgi:outer membrane receptor for ferric coprogen and ferric-rhodotorulic acid
MSHRKPAMRPICVAVKLALLCASTAFATLAHADDNADNKDVVMPSVTVTGESDRVSTEKSGSFGSKKATIVKGVESLRDIPQPVTVLTREYLDERALLDLTDVLMNTPGISVDYTDSERVTYHSRGYQIDAMQVDGMTINQGGSAFAQPDTAVLDRVEILRGAAGMLRGSGNPSATVNLVRKRPAQGFEASADVVLGSWDRHRVSGDIGGSLNQSGSVRGRLVAVSDDKGFFQKARHEERRVFYGVVEADLTPATMLTASLQRTNIDASGAWGGIPANFDGSSLNMPRNTYLGAAWNRWNRSNEQAFASIEHRFDNDWRITGGFGYMHMEMDPNGFKQSYIARPSNATNPYIVGVTTSQYTGDDSRQENYNVTANGPFSLFGRQHQLVVGAESLRVRAIATAGVGSQNPVTNVDIRSWNPYTSYPEATLVSVNNNRPTYTRQKGAYATSSLSLTDALTAMAGVRLSWWEYEASATPASNYKIERQTTPYAALTYDLNKNVNAYVSYTEIFTPQNVKDRNGDMLKPITGEDYELGLKGEFFGGKLNASAGVFRINNVGRAIEDTTSINPCLPYSETGFCRVAGGKTRSQGFEMEVAGEISPNWSITGGYTNTRTKYLVDPSAANVGQPLRSNDPRNQLRLFSTYRLGGALAGWKIGGGANIQSDAYVTSGALTARQGGLAVYNAMASYEVNKRYSVQINVNNLTDKVYYKKFGPTGLAYYYADPLNVSVTLRASL